MDIRLRSWASTAGSARRTARPQGIASIFARKGVCKANPEGHAIPWANRHPPGHKVFDGCCLFLLMLCIIPDGDRMSDQGLLEQRYIHLASQV